jgi:hypothetical protein
MRKFYPILFSLLFGAHTLYAQQIVSSAGGTYAGTNLNVDYSIGECITETFTTGNTKITQGFHQPSYSISTLSKSLTLNYAIEIYPNPVINNLKLTVSDVSNKKLSYKLFEIDGKLINAGIIKDTESELEFENLKVSVYILKVYENAKEVKTFKVVKQ